MNSVLSADLPTTLMMSVPLGCSDHAFEASQQESHAGWPFLAQNGSVVILIRTDPQTSSCLYCPPKTNRESGPANGTSNSPSISSRAFEARSCD
jgi:hypothetical protein